MQGVPNLFWASFTAFCLLFFYRFGVLQGETLSNFGQEPPRATTSKPIASKWSNLHSLSHFSLSKGVEFSVIVTSPRESLGLDFLFVFKVIFEVYILAIPCMQRKLGLPTLVLQSEEGLGLVIFHYSLLIVCTISSLGKELCG